MFVPRLMTTGNSCRRRIFGFSCVGLASRKEETVHESLGMRLQELLSLIRCLNSGVTKKMGSYRAAITEACFMLDTPDGDATICYHQMIPEYHQK